MTTTPEPWDDVGCLRLQVNCISQKVEDVQKGLTAFHGLNDAQLKKLSYEVALIHAQDQEQRSGRWQLKACGIATPLLLGCVLALLACVFALQMFMIYTGLGPRLTQRLSDEAWRAPPDDLTFSLGESAERHLGETNATKRLTSWTGGDDNQPLLEAFQTLQSEVQNDQHPHISSDTDGVAESVNISYAEDSGEVEGDNHDVNDLHTEGVIASSSDPQEVGGHERLPHGVFWVCFPSSSLDQNVKKYAQVFGEVAHRKSMVYPFCHLDTRKSNSDELLCDDVSKITFVLEKEMTTNVASDSTPSQVSREEHIERSSFRDCLDAWMDFPSWFTFKSSARFRRVFSADQDIQASLVDQFLDDVYSGKLQEAVPTKRDL